MSAGGVPVEEIARVAGHRQTSTTELVYRRELRPVITTGAELMDKVFSSWPGGHGHVAGRSWSLVVGSAVSCDEAGAHLHRLHRTSRARLQRQADGEHNDARDE
jgi:hypothetical protein